VSPKFIAIVVLHCNNIFRHCRQNAWFSSAITGASNIAMQQTLGLLCTERMARVVPNSGFRREI
jgi:hypothetical protein